MGAGEQEKTAMKTLITYGSRYGSAEHYARVFAKLTGFSVLPYRKAKSLSDYDRVIHFGALYAGGVMGLKHIIPKLSAKADLIIITVGLADTENPQNLRHIKASIQAKIPNEVLCRSRLFHLRGAIDYKRLNLRHRIMMSLLYTKAKNIPEKDKNAETRAMLETHGKQVSFIDDAALNAIKDTLQERKSHES